MADISPDFLLELVLFVGALIGVWIRLNTRLVKVEVSVQHSDKQFDQIMSHLRRIEDKLDGKADRE